MTPSLPRLRPLVLFAAIAFSASALSQAGETTNRDQYGGDTSIEYRATGHFYTKQLGDRWVFITPDGHPYLSIGINHLGNCITPGKCWSETSRFYAASGANPDAAIKSILGVVRDLNFNSGGGYSPIPAKVRKALPYALTIGYPEGKGFEFDVFDPTFEQALTDHVDRAIRSDSDNPYLLGYYFIDCPKWNEQRIEFYRSLPHDSPGGQILAEFCEEQNITVDEALPAHSQNEFLGIVAQKLYSMMHAAIRQSDPHHLILGEKFVTRKVPKPVLKAITPYIDVFSVQPLGGVAKQDCVTFQRELMDEYYRVCGKPILVPDYACTFFTAETRKTHWHQLKTERVAAEAYAGFLREAFGTPYIIGIHRCELQTWYKPAQKRWRQGILDPSGQPYPILAETVRETNREVIANAYRTLKQ